MENEKTEIKDVDSIDYSCPSCSGPLNYKPSESTLYCEYCGFKKIITGEISQEEHDFQSFKEEDNDWQTEAKIVRCKNCGAENIISNLEICNTCPFCGSNQVIETDELPGIRPHRVVSFTIDKEIAHQSYLKRIKRNIFVSKKVKKSLIKTYITGVYLPSWTFDTETFSTYVGVLGKNYTRVVGSGKNKHVIVETRWFSIRGSQAVNFDDILINSSTRISSTELSKLQPFDTNNSFLYNEQYLVGFTAEHYTIKLHSAWDQAKVNASKVIRKTILKKYSYDVVQSLDVKTNYEKIKFKYVLLPIWIGIFRYNNKIYRFLVNGTNENRIKADIPISALRVTVFILSILGGIALIILLLYVIGIFGSNSI